MSLNDVLLRNDFTYCKVTVFKFLVALILLCIAKKTSIDFEIGIVEVPSKLLVLANSAIPTT